MDLSGLVSYMLAFLINLKLNNKIWCSGDPLPYTYPASIRVNSKLACVGAVITSTWILTLCDCVDRNKSHEVTVRVGMLYTEGKIVKAKKIICQNEFVSDDRTPDKNLALIKIPKIKFTNSIRQVALPILETPSKTRTIVIVLANRPSVGTSFSMNGWMEDKKYYTMKTDFKVRTWGYFGKVVSSDKCLKLKLKSAAKVAVKSKMFCAEFFHRETDDCSADRGTLMLEGAILWGLMNYKHAACGNYKEYVPYIDVTTKTNLAFILSFVKNRQRSQIQVERTRNRRNNRNARKQRSGHVWKV